MAQGAGKLLLETGVLSGMVAGERQSSLPGRIFSRVPAPTKLVEVEAFTKTKELPAGGDTCKEFPVMVRVKAASEWAPRAGVDIVIVLDLIGAIQQGQKLERLKQALMAVIAKLSTCDRLAIISSEAGVASHLVEPTDMSCLGRWKATRAVQKLVLREDRRSNACMKEGAEVLMALEKKVNSSRRVGCVMFLSDGECPPFIERETGGAFPYPVHTFGLGASHDPEGMKRIADQTGGTYSYLDQDTGDISGVFAPLITGLTSVAATSIKITLKAQEGVTISSVESGAYKHRVDKLSCYIDVTDIYAGEQKNFIIYLKIVGGDGKLAMSDADGKVKLVTIGGTYTSKEGEELAVAGPDVCVLPPRQVRPPDEELDEEEELEIEGEVAAELARVELLKHVMKMLGKLLPKPKHPVVNGDDDREDSSEQEPTNDVPKQGPTQNLPLQEIWELFKVSDAARGAPVATLTELSADVAAMVIGIGNPEEHRKSGGLSYTLSWVSCHQWQRATTSCSGAFRVAVAGGAVAPPPPIDRSCSCMGSYRAVLLVSFLLLMRMLYVYSVGGGFGFGLGFHGGFGFGSTVIRPPTWKANTTTALGLSGHPHWPVMEKDFEVMIRKTEDVKITSLFQEASLEAMNEQMDRYLYMAVVHATALRRRNAGYAISDAAAVRSAAGEYLQGMVERMRDVDLPSFQDASPKLMNKEMNRYLYSTIVQSSVVWSHTERFHEESMVTEVTKEKSSVSTTTVDGKTVLVETQDKTVSTTDGKTVVVVTEDSTISTVDGKTVVVVAENATSSTTASTTDVVVVVAENGTSSSKNMVSTTDVIVVSAEMAKATVRITELEQELKQKKRLEIRVTELEKEMVRKTWLESRVAELEKEMVHKATLEVRVTEMSKQLQKEKTTVVSLRSDLATQRTSCAQRCTACDNNVKRCGQMVAMWKARVVELGGSIEEEKIQATVTV